MTTGKCMHTLTGSYKHVSAVTCLAFNDKFIISSSDDGTVKLWNLETGEFIRNLLALESGGRGGVVWRISMHQNKLVCAVGSRMGVEETKLILLDFDWPPSTNIEHMPLLSISNSSNISNNLNNQPVNNNNNNGAFNNTATIATTSGAATHATTSNNIVIAANRMNQSNQLYQMLSS